MKLKFNEKYTKYVWIHILLFLSSSIIGVLFGRIVGNIGDIPFLEKPFYDYFFHNLLSCFTLIGVGIITYGFLTWIPLIYNGIVLGMAINFLSYYHSAKDILRYFLHAIFEIPALMLSIYLGKVLAVELKSMLLSMIKKGKIEETDLKNIFKLLILMIILLFIASIIEAMPKV